MLLMRNTAGEEAEEGVGHAEAEEGCEEGGARLLCGAQCGFDGVEWQGEIEEDSATGAGGDKDEVADERVGEGREAVLAQEELQPTVQRAEVGQLRCLHRQGRRRRTQLL